LGLLSKYTTGLLAGSALAFVVVDGQARKAIKTVFPYAAVAVAVVFFSPVLYWNSNHHWMSFAFQGSRRWSMAPNFHLHVLLGSALVLLTPVGLIDTGRTIWRGVRRVMRDIRNRVRSDRNRLFALIFCFLPLSVFVVHSLANQTKLNWTGPVWLSVLPFVAARISLPQREGSSRWTLGLRPSWIVTVMLLAILYPVGLSWLAMGGPGMPANKWNALPVAWEEFGEQVEQIEEAIEEQGGTEPLVIGTDKYWIASQLSFYHDIEDERDSLPEFAGSGILRSNDLMWSQWMPSDSARGREIIMVAFHERDVGDDRVGSYFSSLSPVMRQPIRTHGRQVGEFYWRLGMNYAPQ
jgi:dolichol-phosphate mannosyltransferase